MAKSSEFDSNIIHKAIVMAATAHVAQTDLDGKYYILHITRVASKFMNHFQIIVAWLHDIVEDTNHTLDGIEEVFGKRIRDGVDAITKRNGEDYENYIYRVAHHPEVIPIKMADLEDNMNILRRRILNEKDLKRLNKYIYAYNRLKAELLGGEPSLERRSN